MTHELKIILAIVLCYAVVAYLVAMWFGYENAKYDTHHLFDDGWSTFLFSVFCPFTILCISAFAISDALHEFAEKHSKAACFLKCTAYIVTLPLFPMKLGKAIAEFVHKK